MAEVYLIDNAKKTQFTPQKLSGKIFIGEIGT